MNGAIGTLDGANIEIQRSGSGEFFLFGLTAEEVITLKSKLNQWTTIRPTSSAKSSTDPFGIF
jgi:glucan phosphorylase